MKNLKFKIFVLFLVCFIAINFVNGINLDKIVFVRGGDIYTMNSDGSNQIDITNSPANDREPDWSPDGSKIVFVKNDDISIMNSDGSNIVQLTYDGTTYGGNTVPAWSPDGTKIAFQSNRDGNNEVYVMNSDGSNQIDLSNNNAVDHYATWSPDGTKIAFTSTRDGNNEIYVMNLDGTGQTRLTNIPGDDFDSSWSPDGTKIAFASTRDGGNYEIYLMNADGTNPIRLTNTPAHDYYPAWSPDGTKIIFDSLRDGNNEIYVMNLDGTGQTRLTFSGGSYPDWIDISSHGIDENGCIYNTKLTNPLGLAWDGTNFWYSDEVDRKVYKVSTDGSILGSFTGPGGAKVHGLAWDGAYLWLVSYPSGNLYKINTTKALIDGNTNNAIVSTISSFQSYTESMSYGNNALWITFGSGNNHIYKIDPTTGNKIGETAVGPFEENRMVGCSWKDSNLLCSFMNGITGEYLSIKEIDAEKALSEGNINNSIVAEHIPQRGESSSGIAWINPKIWYTTYSNNSYIGRICPLIISGGGGGGGSVIGIPPANTTITINGSTNLTQQYSGTLEVILQQASETVAEFYYNFSESPLNITDLEIEKEPASATKAYIILRGLEVQNTKILYMNKLNTNLNYVCVKDAEINDISEITNNCQGSNEYLVPCNGNNFNGYTCTKTDENYVITGLKHSAIKEYGGLTTLYSLGTCYFGDTNGDCGISARDIATINNYIRNKPNSFSCNWKQVDVDGDGNVTSADINELKNYIIYQPFNFNGKPTNIIATVTTPGFDGNFIIGNTYDIEVLITDIDGTPRPCINVDFSSDKGILNKNYDTLTDINGKISLSLIVKNNNPTYLTSFIKGNNNKGINNIQLDSQI